MKSYTFANEMRMKRVSNIFANYSIDLFMLSLTMLFHAMDKKISNMLYNRLELQNKR